MADVSVTFGAKDVGLKATMKALSDELTSLTAKTKSTQMGFVELKTTLGRMNEIKKVQNDLRSLGDEATKTATKAKGIGSAFGALKGGLAAVGVGVGFGAIISQSKQIIADFARIQDLADRFNTSAESIQRLASAARFGGTDIDTVATALTKAGMAATDVVTGNQAMADAFQRVGINAQEFVNADIDQKLLIISDAFQKANGDAVKINSIIEILGTRGGANLIPLISKLDELRKNMKDSAVATGETVSRLAEADNRLKTFGNNLKIYAADVLSFLDKQGEKIGNLFAGKGSKLDEEIKSLEEAEKRLAARGITRPEAERRTVMVPTPVGMVPAERDMPGVRAAEFEKKLVAEVAKMKQEALEEEKKKRNEILKLQKQQQEEARKQAALEKRITEENEAQSRAREKIAEDMRAAESRVAAQAAEDERRELEKILDLDVKIAEAKLSGSKAAIETAEAEKKQYETRKKHIELVSKFLATGAETLTSAAEKAGKILAAEEIPQRPARSGGGFQGRMPEPTNIGAQMRQAAEQARAQQRIVGARGAMFQRAMQEGRFGEAARLGRSIERRAEDQRRREDIIELGDIIEKSFRSNVGVLGAKTATEKGIGGVTAREFARKSAFDQARELGIKTIGKSTSDLRKEIDKSIESFKDLQDGLDEETAQQQERKQRRQEQDTEDGKVEKGGRTVVDAVDELKTEVMNRLPIVTLN